MVKGLTKVGWSTELGWVWVMGSTELGLAWVNGLDGVGLGMGMGLGGVGLGVGDGHHVGHGTGDGLDGVGPGAGGCVGPVDVNPTSSRAASPCQEDPLVPTKDTTMPVE